MTAGASRTTMLTMRQTQCTASRAWCSARACALCACSALLASSDRCAGDTRSHVLSSRPHTLVCVHLCAQFPSYEFRPWLHCVFRSVAGLIERLPSSMANANRPSSLLALVHTMSVHASVAPRLGDYPALLPAVLRCLSAGITWCPDKTDTDGAEAKAGSDGEADAGDGVATSDAIEGTVAGRFKGSGPGDRVVLCLLEIVTNLLATTASGTPALEPSVRDEDGALVPVPKAQQSLLTPHVQVLLDQLCVRLGAKSYASGYAQRMRFLRRELAILLAVARYEACAGCAPEARRADDMTSPVPVHHVTVYSAGTPSLVALAPV